MLVSILPEVLEFEDKYYHLGTDHLNRPINTYNSQGVTKSGLSESGRRSHAIIYMTDTRPSCLPEEENSVVSHSQASFSDNQSFVSFPSQTEMKNLPSAESNASSLSSSSQRSQSRMLQRISEQNAQGNVRPFAPKQECHDDSCSTKAKIPKIIEVMSDDGTIRHKVEIPPTRQQPQRKITFCQLCDDHPQGFRGEHELRRHVERHHATYRKSLDMQRQRIDRRTSSCRTSLEMQTKHVATVRRMVPTTTQPRTLDVRISSPARISEVAWVVEKSHPWMS